MLGRSQCGSTTIRPSSRFTLGTLARPRRADVAVRNVGNNSTTRHGRGAVRAGQGDDRDDVFSPVTLTQTRGRTSTVAWEQPRSSTPL
jgi:hypothetical protein